MNSLFLFAPKFREFGIDIATEWHHRHTGKLLALCTGGASIMKRVEAGTSEFLAETCDIENLESNFGTTPVDEAQLEAFQARYEDGAFGRIVTADRRIGAGFVRGGRVRPSHIADLAKINHNFSVNYVVNLCTFLENLFDKHQPRFVFCYAVAGALAVALAEVSRVRGVTFTRLLHSRIKDRHLVDTDYMGRMHPVSELFSKAMDNPSIISDTRAQAREILAAFRKNFSQPSYMTLPQNDISFWSTIKKIPSNSVFLLASTARILIRRNKSAQESFRRSVFNFVASLRKLIDLRKINRLSRAPQGRFILYTLHVDPEASTMVTAPSQTNQFAIIESLAKWAPIEYTIIVKEHAPMVGYRPAGFYEAIAKMPRVQLAPLSTSGVRLIQRSALVVSITGTISLEAIQLGKPSLVFGAVPWQVVPDGCIKVASTSDTSEFIIRSLASKPTPESSIEIYIACILKKTFSMPGSLIWERYLNHDKHIREEAISNIITGIENCVKISRT